MSIENIFLDRDGTIIQDMHYLKDPEKISLIPEAVQAMKEMSQQDRKIFIVTNQSGIGRKYFSNQDYFLIEKTLDKMLTDQGIKIQDSIFCPHQPEEQCSCRKPQTGMWEQLFAKHSLSSEYSIMVGDKKSDLDFGANCGFYASILVLTGKGRKTLAQLEIDENDSDWFEPQIEFPVSLIAAQNLLSAWQWIKKEAHDAF
ncbi:MAG: HAD-IIIA family hydrolase [Desulfonatronovibrio sp. MSAO_Bac4]|nr:MAG: HAD-IIIA family hydrolase [Desulfonatronovibrio sp. MSAO_Bac4]